MPYRDLQVCDYTDAMSNGEHAVPSDIDSMPRRADRVPTGGDAVSEVLHTVDARGGRDTGRATVPGTRCDLSDVRGGQAVNRFA